MNNCALNLSASVIATALLSMHHNRHRIVSRPCNYYTLCLHFGVEAGGRWLLAKENRNTLRPILLQLLIKNHITPTLVWCLILPGVHPLLSRSHSDAAHREHDRNKTRAHITAWQSRHFTLFLNMCNLMTRESVYILHILLFSRVLNWSTCCGSASYRHIDTSIEPVIASGCGPLQAVVQHGWLFS